MVDLGEPYGSLGWDTDAQGNLIPRAQGTRINSNPFETPTLDPSPQVNPNFATPQGGPVVPRGYGPSPASSGPRAGQPVTPYSTSTTTIRGPNGQPLATPRLNTPNSQTGIAQPPPATEPVSGSLGTLGGSPITGILSGAGALSATEFDPRKGNAVNQAVDNSVLGQALQRLGITGPSNQWATDPQTQTQTEPQSARPGPPSPPVQTPPGEPPGGQPPGYPPLPPPRPPWLNAPLPYNPTMPSHARAPAIHPAPGAGSPAAAPPVSITPGEYRASIGDARHQTWLPAGHTSVALYNGPQTMYGRGPEPGNFQNAYIPGSAPLAQGDWGWPRGQAPTAAPAAPTSSGGRGSGAQNVPLSQTPLPPPRPADFKTQWLDSAARSMNPNWYASGGPL